MKMNKEIVIVRLSDIIPNRFQPRLAFDEEALNELADSIREHGIIQPLILRDLGNKYEIIAGERRFKAAELAGATEVPALIGQMDDQTSAELALIENIQRKDLSAIEEAKSYKKILDMGDFTQEELAKRMGKSQSTIANKMRLLALTNEVQMALMNNLISERHARCLLQIKDENTQKEVLNKIISERMTVRDTDNYIKNTLGINQTAVDDKEPLSNATPTTVEPQEEKSEVQNDNPNVYAGAGNNDFVDINSLTPSNEMPEEALIENQTNDNITEASNEEVYDKPVEGLPTMPEGMPEEAQEYTEEAVPMAEVPTEEVYDKPAEPLPTMPEGMPEETQEYTEEAVPVAEAPTEEVYAESAEPLPTMPEGMPEETQEYTEEAVPVAEAPTEEVYAETAEPLPTMPEGIPEETQEYTEEEVPTAEAPTEEVYAETAEPLPTVPEGMPEETQEYTEEAAPMAEMPTEEVYAEPVNTEEIVQEQLVENPVDIQVPEIETPNNQNNISRIKMATAIRYAKDALNDIQTAGYQASIEEKDNGNSYQIIINVQKQD